MAIQYTIPIRSYDNRQWRANIYSDSYSGLITTLKGSEGQSMLLEYSGDIDDHFAVFIKSTLTLNVLNEGNIDVNQLQNSADREYRIEIQRENVLYWVGYVIAEDIEQPLRSDASVFRITAICGLTMLSDMDYIHNNLPGVNGIGSRCPMNYIRQILFAQNNLNVPIPVRWTNNIRNTVFEGQDVFIGGVQWSPRGEGFNEYDVTTGDALPKKNNYILEGILKSMQCRIYQANGRWNIRRVPDYYTGSFRYTQIPGNLGAIIPLSANEVIANRIGQGGYPFINERDLLTNVPGIKSCKVTYNADVKENILPNGNQDLSSLASPIYWGFFDPTDTSVSQIDGSLDGRSGYSSELWNFGADTKHFTTLSTGAELRTNGLPIDAKNLVKKMNFSFYFTPKSGFPITGNINGVITSTSIVNGGSGYPNGLRTNVDIIKITGSGINATADIFVTGGAITSVTIKSGGENFNIGDQFRIVVPPVGLTFVGQVTGVKSVPGFIDFESNPLQLQIIMNIGANQFFLNEFGIWVIDSTTLISPHVEGLKVDDVARVTFDRFQGGIKLLEPDFVPKAGDICDIKVLFLVKSGQKYIIDNISITIEDSDDVFVNSVDNSKNTKEESKELTISSSFGGYMVSNFMTNWDKSDSECEFIDGDKYTGTLTGMTADATIRCKYTSSKIYNGTINVRDKNWSFDEIYLIETLADRRFMPINATYNIEKCQVDLVAIETRNDDISRTENQYGSNSKQLSN